MEAGGKILRESRFNFGVGDRPLNQADLAALIQEMASERGIKVRCSKSAISNFENGKPPLPNAPVIGLLEEFFHLPKNMLAEGFEVDRKRKAHQSKTNKKYREYSKLFEYAIEQLLYGRDVINAGAALEGQKIVWEAKDRLESFVQNWQYCPISGFEVVALHYMEIADAYAHVMSRQETVEEHLSIITSLKTLYELCPHNGIEYQLRLLTAFDNYALGHHQAALAIIKTIPDPMKDFGQWSGDFWIVLAHRILGISGAMCGDEESCSKATKGLNGILDKNVRSYVRYKALETQARIEAQRGLIVAEKLLEQAKEHLPVHALWLRLSYIRTRLEIMWYLNINDQEAVERLLEEARIIGGLCSWFQEQILGYGNNILQRLAS